MLLVINNSGTDTHAHTHTRAHTHTHTHKHTHTYTHIQTHTYTNTQTDKYTHTQTHTHTQIFQTNLILRNQVHASIQPKHTWFKSDYLFSMQDQFSKAVQEDWESK